MYVEELEPFIDDGFIEEVIRPVKSGKEADVYLCAAAGSTGETLIGAKVYRSIHQRSFKNDSMYREGTHAELRARDRRAVAKKTTFGKYVLFGTWIAHELETLEILYAAGARVPKPIRSAEHALLMTWIGDEEGAAPHLRQVRPDPEEAARWFSELVRQVELFLACNRVHSDLSEYNILAWNGKLTIIDFPQAVDPRFNRNAYDLLQRDMENLARYFSRFGVVSDPRRMVSEMWGRWLHAGLLPAAVGEAGWVE